MVFHRVRPIRSSLAVVLAFCLLSTSMGLECQQALAQVTEGEAPGAINPGITALGGLETGLMSLPAGSGQSAMPSNAAGGLPSSPGPANPAMPGRASAAAAAKSETISKPAGIALPLSAISPQGLAGRAQGSITAPIGVQAVVKKEGGRISRWMKTLAPSFLSAKKLDLSTGEAAQDLGRRIMGDGRPAGLAPDPAVAGHDEGAGISAPRAAQERLAPAKPGVVTGVASRVPGTSDEKPAQTPASNEAGSPYLKLSAGTAVAAGVFYGLTFLTTAFTPLAWGAAVVVVFFAGLAAGTFSIAISHRTVYSKHGNRHELENPPLDFLGNSLAYGSLLFGAGAWAVAGAGAAVVAVASASMLLAAATLAKFLNQAAVLRTEAPKPAKEVESASAARPVVPSEAPRPVWRQGHAASPKAARSPKMSLATGTAIAAGVLYALTSLAAAFTPLPWGWAGVAVFFGALSLGIGLKANASRTVISSHGNWSELEHPLMDFLGDSLLYGSLLILGGALASFLGLGAYLGHSALAGGAVLGSVQTASAPSGGGRLPNPDALYARAFNEAGERAEAMGRRRDELYFGEATASMPALDGRHWTFSFYLMPDLTSAAIVFSNPGTRTADAVFVHFSAGPGAAAGQTSEVRFVRDAVIPAGLRPEKLPSSRRLYPSPLASPDEALHLARKKSALGVPASVSFRPQREKESNDLWLWYRFSDGEGAEASVNAATGDTRARRDPLRPFIPNPAEFYPQAYEAAVRGAEGLGLGPERVFFHQWSVPEVGGKKDAMKFVFYAFAVEEGGHGHQIEIGFSRAAGADEWTMSENVLTEERLFETPEWETMTFASMPPEAFVRALTVVPAAALETVRKAFGLRKERFDVELDARGGEGPGQDGLTYRFIERSRFGHPYSVVVEADVRDGQIRNLQLGQVRKAWGELGLEFSLAMVVGFAALWVLLAFLAPGFGSSEINFYRWMGSTALYSLAGVIFCLYGPKKSKITGIRTLREDVRPPS